MIDLGPMRTPVDERGAGPCCIYIHGLGGDLQSWNPIWPLLRADRRSVRYDLRHFGGSVSVGDETFAHADDLERLLDALDVDACDLAGVSMGGGIALGFALDRPHRVRTLTLISPQIMGWEWSVEWQGDWERITDAARAGDMAGAKRMWWEHRMFDAIRSSPAAVHLQEEIDRFSGSHWLHDRHALVMPDMERLHTLAPPTLLLSGSSDAQELRLMADVLAACVPRIARIDVEGGHLLHMEAPDLCATYIAAFQDAHSGR